MAIEQTKVQSKDNQLSTQGIQNFGNLFKRLVHNICIHLFESGLIKKCTAFSAVHFYDEVYLLQLISIKAQEVQ